MEKEPAPVKVDGIRIQTDWNLKAVEYRGLFDNLWIRIQTDWNLKPSTLDNKSQTELFEFRQTGI